MSGSPTLSPITERTPPNGSHTATACSEGPLVFSCVYLIRADHMVNAPFCSCTCYYLCNSPRGIVSRVQRRSSNVRRTGFSGPDSLSGENGLLYALSFAGQGFLRIKRPPSGGLRQGEKVIRYPCPVRYRTAYGCGQHDGQRRRKVFQGRCGR